LAVSGEYCAKVVGIDTDGASVKFNIANTGLKGLVEKELQWLVWMWCMARHAVRISCEKQTTSDLINDMLLRLHLLYGSSPKNAEN